MIFMFKFSLIFFITVFAAIMSRSWLTLIAETYIERDKGYRVNGFLYTLIAISMLFMMVYAIIFVINVEVIV